MTRAFVKVENRKRSKRLGINKRDRDLGNKITHFAKISDHSSSIIVMDGRRSS
jgi:uncharacterized Fe-S cluster-containing protein